MIHTLISCALFAAAAFAPSAGARDLQQVEASGSSSSDGKHGNDVHTSRPVSYTNHRTKKSEIKCSAEASTQSYAAAKDAHVSAVTDAIVYGCSHEVDPYWARDIEKIIKEKAGYAVAEVWANAKAKCTGVGNVDGCAYAFAEAEAWAKATVSAYADAFALAINDCKCNKHDQIEEAIAYGSAYEFEKLVAHVKATAQADACIWHAGTAEAEVNSHCLQDLYANAFALSVSKALIKGGCYKGFSAKADIKAVAVIDTWEYVDCYSNAS